MNENAHANRPRRCYQKKIGRHIAQSAAEIAPGKKHGGYRAQATGLLVNAAGHSEITYPDYADAFVDEIEQAKYVRQVATAAY